MRSAPIATIIPKPCVGDGVGDGVGEGVGDGVGDSVGDGAGVTVGVGVGVGATFSPNSTNVVKCVTFAIALLPTIFVSRRFHVFDASSYM